MKFVRKLFATAALISATVFAGGASAQVTTFNSQSDFAAGTTGNTPYGFDFSAKPLTGTTYTNGPVTFASSGLTSYDDAYGMPYITDNNYGSALSNTFSITSTTSALGLYLGSYEGNATYTYVVNGVAGSVAVPAPDDSIFLGFANASGPISVTFNVGSGINANSELDVPRFVTGNAIPGAVPEPASWAMMILGMGAVGFATRNAKRRSNEKFDAKIKKITYGAIA